jgi:hypothetical protein
VYTEPSFCEELKDSDYDSDGNPLVNSVEEIKRCSITNGPEGEKCEGGQKPDKCDEPTGRDCRSEE